MDVSERLTMDIYQLISEYNGDKLDNMSFVITFCLVPSCYSSRYVIADNAGDLLVLHYTTCTYICFLNFCTRHKVQKKIKRVINGQ